MVGRGGSRGIGLDLRIDRHTLIGDLGNKTMVVISSVLHMLDPSIGKSNRVGSKHIAIGISRLSSVEGSLGVIILDSILVGVGLPWLRSWGIHRLRGIGRCRGIGGGRNRDRGICWGRRRRGRGIKGSRSRTICRNWNWSWC